MSSKSLRIDGDLFDAAIAEGALMSRSAAQQIEHWARLGLTLETCGLTIHQVAALLRGGVSEGSLGTDANDADPLAFKRRMQAKDIDAINAGRVSQDQLSWFSGGKARGLKIIGSPY